MPRPATNIDRSRTEGVAATRRAAVTVAGTRCSFDVVDVPLSGGSAGIGWDATEVETLRGEIARTVEAHRRTLDQLPSAVAIFGADHKLAFYNAAYRTLWDLEARFLDEHPTDSAVLDRLRASRRLPEQQDFRSWKGQLHAAYRATEPQEFVWHLPDLRTLRVVTTPNPDGGVTYLFDDVTERLNLERRFDALIRVQRETLDNLSEAVAVFGSDGRVRLFNPEFAHHVGPRRRRCSTSIRTSRRSSRRAARSMREEATWQALRDRGHRARRPHAAHAAHRPAKTTPSSTAAPCRSRTVRRSSPSTTSPPR